MKLPPVPKRIARLKRDAAGRPVPWFVQWFEDGSPTPYGTGKPDFRIADMRKIRTAHLEHRCWICGDHLSAKKTFPIGPMCAVNRTSSEPPSHLECCAFSVQICPFLSRPGMARPDKPFPEGTVDAAGEMIMRNPGVTALWTTRSYELMRVDNGVLFRLGPPEALEWWAEGKPASLAQIAESMRTGLPILIETACESPNPAELPALMHAFNEAIALVPGLGIEMLKAVEVGDERQRNPD